MLHISLPVGTDAAARVRAAIHETLETVVADPPLSDLLLVATELVTNCVRHAGLRPGQQIAVTIARSGGDEVMVEVRDPGNGLAPAPNEVEGLPSESRGLRIVARLAKRWGVHRDEGTRVWAVL